MMNLYKGDCLKIMDKLIKEGCKVDAVICDPPYGTTSCRWDNVIPLNKHLTVLNSRGKEKIVYRDEYLLHSIKNGEDYNKVSNYFDQNAKEGMWDKLNKLVKPKGGIVLFATQPFTSELGASNIKNLRYEIIWHKIKPSNFQMMNFQFGRVHENILVFSKSPAVYSRGNHMIYNPQMDIRSQKYSSSSKYYGKDNISTLRGVSSMKGIKKEYKQKHPTSIISFSNANQRSKLHPTQKPIDLIKYLVKTYTNKNDIVLDFTMGSGTTGVACSELHRGFIGIELDENYFNIATRRINEIKDNI